MSRAHQPAVLTPLVALWIAVAVPGSASAQGGFQPTDYYSVVSVGEVAVAPDGDLVAFTVTRVSEEENGRRREIWIQPLELGSPQGSPYRFTDAAEDSHSPRWSPDGSQLSFTSKRGEDDNSIWFVRVIGPGGEAFHLEGVDGEPIWSPDGQQIVFAMAQRDDLAEREGWISPSAVSSTMDEERFDGRVITSTRYKRDGVLTLMPDPATRAKRQLYIVAADGGVPRRLTSLNFDVSGPVWSPDGRIVYFTGDERQDDGSNRELTGDIWAVTVADGGVRQVTPNPGSESGPSISPDGGRLAFVLRAETGAPRDLLVVDLAPDGTFANDPVNLTAEFDLDAAGPSWSADGTALHFVTRSGGDRHLFRVAAVGGAVAPVTRGERQLASVSFSAQGNVMAYTATDAITPTEMYVARGDGTGEVRATNFNDGWLDRVALERPERLTWRVSDSTEIEGWVVKPVGYRPGQKYPLVLKIHGGPHSAYGNTFFPTFHVLSAAGFFVLYANPRGSNGYGNAFEFSTRGQWGLMDSEDFLSGIDAALAKYPDVDPELLGVSGGSYGGFMTNWLTATTDVFQAAATSRSITNWESWWGSSDAQRLTEFEFFGAPWERRDLYRRLSPISYVENVTAPTLIIHSEKDYRTPIGDGEQWYMALKRQGVPVEMVRYPRSSHGLSRTGEPWLLVDRLERIRSWFVHWLIESPPSAVAGG